MDTPALAAGCFSTTKTDKSIQYGDALQDTINNYEQSRSEAISQLNKVTQRTQEVLRTEKPDLREVSRRWEEGWDNIQSKIKALEEEFSEVGKRSSAYFDKLEKIAADIKDSTTRDFENSRNVALKRSWTEAFYTASQDIHSLRSLSAKSQDFHLLLIGHALRGDLQVSIGQFESISSRTRGLLEQLQALTQEGRKLVEGEEKFAMRK